MLNLGFHEVEELFSRVGAAQQPTWDEMELSGKNLRAIQGR